MQKYINMHINHLQVGDTEALPAAGISVAYLANELPAEVIFLCMPCAKYDLIIL